MILSNLDQVPGTLWSLLLLAHFTGEKTVSERQSGGAQIQAKGSVVPEPVLLNFAASLCVHIDGGKILHREEMHRQRPGGPQRYIMFLERV